MTEPTAAGDAGELDATAVSSVEVNDDTVATHGDTPIPTDNRPRPEDGPQGLPQDAGSVVEGDAVVDGTPEADA